MNLVTTMQTHFIGKYSKLCLLHVKYILKPLCPCYVHLNSSRNRVSAIYRAPLDNYVKLIRVDQFTYPVLRSVKLLRNSVHSQHEIHNTKRTSLILPSLFVNAQG